MGTPKRVVFLLHQLSEHYFIKLVSLCKPFFRSWRQSLTLGIFPRFSKRWSCVSCRERWCTVYAKSIGTSIYWVVMSQRVSGGLDVCVRWPMPHRKWALVVVYFLIWQCKFTTCIKHGLTAQTTLSWADVERSIVHLWIIWITQVQRQHSRKISLLKLIIHVTIEHIQRDVRVFE